MKLKGAVLLTLVYISIRVLVLFEAIDSCVTHCDGPSSLGAKKRRTTSLLAISNIHVHLGLGPSRNL